MAYNQQSNELNQYNNRNNYNTSLDYRTNPSTNNLNQNNSYAPSYPTNTNVQPYNTYGESQVNRVYEPVNNQQVRTTVLPNNSVTYVQPNNQNSVIVDQRTQVVSTNDSRYDSYLSGSRPADYKYNAFSALDEQWNRCQAGQKCGSCPGNECIAREALNKVWR
jgi:hypothetical protein